MIELQLIGWQIDSDAIILNFKSLLSLIKEEKQLDIVGKQEIQNMILKVIGNCIIWMILMILKKDFNLEIIE